MSLTREQYRRRVMVHAVSVAMIVVCFLMVASLCYGQSPAAGMVQVAEPRAAAYYQVAANQTAVEPTSINAQQPHPSSCRVWAGFGGTACIGSGTLIARDDQTGVVMTAAHVVEQYEGGPISNQITCTFPDRRRHAAKVIAFDRQADLCALWIAQPTAPAAEVTLPEVQPAGLFYGCGYGGQGVWRCGAGHFLGFSNSSGRQSLELANYARSGDSGGGCFDARGRWCGVVWGSDGRIAAVSYGGPLRNFLARLFGPIPVAVMPTRLIDETQCYGGVCRPPGQFGSPQYGYSQPSQSPSTTVPPPSGGGLPKPWPTQPSPGGQSGGNQGSGNRNESPSKEQPAASPSQPVAGCPCDLSQYAKASSVDALREELSDALAKMAVPGPAGPRGPAGPSAEIDYAQLAGELQQRLPPLRVDHVDATTGETIRSVEKHLGDTLTLRFGAGEKRPVER